MREKQQRERKAKKVLPSYPFARFINSLPGRVVLVVVATVAAAFGFSLLLRISIPLQPSILRWVAAAVVGTAAGFAARGLLADRTAALRLWASLLALLSGLVALGLMTGGMAGAALPETSAAADASSAPLNWTWLGQFVFGSALAWLTLNAFPVVAAPIKTRKRKSSATARPRSAGTARKKPASLSDTGEKSEQKPAQKPARKTASRSASKRPERLAGARPSTAVQTASTASGAAAAEETSAPQKRPPARRRSPVIHPQSPAAQSNPAPIIRTLWIAPAAAPRRRAASPGRPSVQPQLEKGERNRWRGVNTQLQTWWRKGLHTPGGIPSERTPAPTARPVRPRSPARPSPPTQPQNNRPRFDGLKLPPWLTIKNRVRPRAQRARAIKDESPAEHLSPVRLVGDEEHRCPFCLELVEPDDARGVVECSICHTRHHADCWDVTGACQVPHYHG